MGRSFEVRKASMAKTAGQKTKIYSKYGKMLYVLAKNTGADPTVNSTLRSLIEKAKREQVPAHVIEKALENHDIGHKNVKNISSTTNGGI